MRDLNEQRSETAKPGPSAIKMSKKQTTADRAHHDLSFDALVQDDLVRLLMASDKVSMQDMLDLRDVRPLIS